MTKLNYVFIALSIGLTFISLFAGFGCYTALFGTSMAILISVIFEVLRLSTLYSINLFDGFYKRLAFGLYFIVALVCFSAGIVSFGAKVIESQDIRQIEIKAGMSEDAYKLKNAFSKKIDERIQRLETDKTKIRVALNNNPDSKIWNARLVNIDEQIKEANEERDKFLFDAAETKDQSSWISFWKAKLGVNDVKDNYKDLASPTSRAATEIFGINDLQLQKWAGIILTLAVEIGIILLAILGMYVKKRVRKEKEILVPEALNNVKDLEIKPEKEKKRKIVGGKYAKS